MIYLVFLIYADYTNISIIIKATTWLVNEASKKKFQICDKFIGVFCDYAETNAGFVVYYGGKSVFDL